MKMKVLLGLMVLVWAHWTSLIKWACGPTQWFLSKMLLANFPILTPWATQIAHPMKAWPLRVKCSEWALKIFVKWCLVIPWPELWLASAYFWWLAEIATSNTGWTLLRLRFSFTENLGLKKVWSCISLASFTVQRLIQRTERFFAGRGDTLASRYRLSMGTESFTFWAINLCSMA